MTTAFKIAKTAAILFLYAAGAAFANEAPADQNAFTRVMKKPLQNIASPVANTDNSMCNSVIECRKYGGDLKTKWQMDNATDTSPKEYPENCYVPGNDGKYIFSAPSCAKYGRH